MTNSDLLEAKVEESGYKKSFLADQLGLSRQGFLNKVQGKTSFYSHEILKLEELLNLSKKEREDIFFNIEAGK